MSVSGVASAVLGMQQDVKSANLAAAFAKQKKMADQAVVGMLDQALAAPKAAGTGLVVDKSA